MSKQEINEFSLNNLKELLLTMPRAHYASSDREISFRCPFCMDSKSNPYTTSFSVNVDPNSENFGRYHCFRANCGVSGVLNDEFFDLINLTDHRIRRDFSSFLKNKPSQSRSSKIIGDTYHREIKNTINSLYDISKLEYVNSRLGLNLNVDDIYSLKMNLNIGELYKFNHIDISDKDVKYFKSLMDYGLVFISTYNDYVIIRDTSDDNKLKVRYRNIPIFGRDNCIRKAYTIPSEIDLLSIEPVEINICEGPFDILGVFFHLKKKNRKNKLYIAACGANIPSTLLFYIKQYGLIHCKINIFSDNDISIDKYNSLYKLKNYLTSESHITIYYNKLYKDWGVTKDMIKLQKHELF